MSTSCLEEEPPFDVIMAQRTSTRRLISSTKRPGLHMKFKIEIEREEDGRWIAEVPDLPGVMVYGPTRAKAIRRVQALALRVLADRIEHGEEVPEVATAFSVTS